MSISENISAIIMCSVGCGQAIHIRCMTSLERINMEIFCDLCEEMLYESSYGSYGDFSSVSENAIEQARRDMSPDECPCFYCVRINL